MKFIKKYKYIIAFLIFVIFMLFTSPEKEETQETAPQQETQSEHETETQENSEKKGFRIGKSNIIAFIILGGALVYIELKKYKDENGKD